MHWIYHTVRAALISGGYWAILAALLGERAGLPFPGETVLVFASFLAHKHRHLALPWVMVAGPAQPFSETMWGITCAAILAQPSSAGAKKLLHLESGDIPAAEDLLRRQRTIFFSRFIFCLCTIAGPLAGRLEMEGKVFFQFNNYEKRQHKEAA